MATMAVTELSQSEQSTISWGAVIAGGVAAAAMSLFLLALGVGLGLSSISPWSDQGVSATTFHVGAGVYLVAVAMLSSTVGGYLAGRLRASWAGVHYDEIYFRDTAHGLVTWAFATLLSASALGAATTHILAGSAAGLAPAAATAAQGQPTDIYIDRLLRADPTTSNTAATQPAGQPATGVAAMPSPAQDNRAAATRGEMSRMLMPVLRKGGDVSAADRTYLARVISARTGLPQAEAEKRVNDVITQAKQATDDARKAMAKLMLWLAASMLAGAVASMLGATEGGVLRDSKWYEPGWRADLVRNH
jgi:hypothetical protein